MSLLSFIWKFLRAQRLSFILIAVFSLAWTFEMLYWPYFLADIVDILNAYDTKRTMAWTYLTIPLLLAALFWFVMDISYRLRDFVQAKAFSKIEADIRMDMFDHIQRHSPKYFNEHFAGSLANKISDMVYTATMLVRTSLTLLLPAFLSCVIAIIIFSRINFTLAMIVGLWIVSHVVLSLILTRKCARGAHLHGKARSALAGKIVDSLTNNFVVNLFYRFIFENRRISHYQKREKKINYQAQIYITKMFAALSIAMTLEIFILTRVSLYYWTNGQISTGAVVQLLFTVLNLTMVLFFVADSAPEFFQSLGVAKQALSVMRAPQDILDPVGAIDLKVLQGNIVFDNVSFGYGKAQIFQNKNLTIHAGEKVGLVGYSGAGKSTFVNLILRFFSVEQGRILIDGQDISQVTLQSLREQIALIPQDPILFHRSLEDNIRYGKVDASKEEVVEAAKQAHCNEFIKKTSNGYSSLVGERGTKLSGGEKQRIAIARAMLLKAPILILDEATSALDSMTERYIQDSLEKLMENRTTIVVAHRLSTLSKMDRILVFNHGKIVEEGSHEQLLNQKGHYAKLWNMQAGGFLPDGPPV